MLSIFVQTTTLFEVFSVPKGQFNSTQRQRLGISKYKYQLYVPKGQLK
jgi:hypothetical protein